MDEKIALAPCNGMSPNGLVCRVAVGDLKKENEKVISICMGSTSADIENKNTPMLKKYPIMAINGCKNNCVNTILENKGVEVFKTINAADVLENYSVRARDPFRLDDEAEKCVKIIKKELENSL
ncbi:putative zinc-binding protein [Methanobrevibacter sp.]